LIIGRSLTGISAFA